MAVETVEKILLRYEPKRENLVAATKEISQKSGFISETAVKLMAGYFDMKEAEVFSAASFYDQIKTEQPARIIIQVCDSANCQTKLADKIISSLEILLRQKAGDDFNPQIEIERISCLGRCAEGPNVVINGTLYNRMDAGKVIEIVSEYI